VFWDDLVEEVTEAQAGGDQVMILMDINKDVEGLTFLKWEWWMQSHPSANQNCHPHISKDKNQQMESSNHHHYLKAPPSRVSGIQ